MDFEIDLVYHAVELVGVIVLNDLNALGGKSALLAEAEDIDTCTGSDGDEEHFKG